MNAADTFYIEGYNNGTRYFYIRPYGSSQVINVTNATTADLTTIDIDNAYNNSRWEIYRYTDVHRWGCTYMCPTGWSNTGIPVNSSGDVTLTTVWSTYVNGNTPSIGFPFEYFDMGTIRATTSVLTINFTAYSAGTVKFKIEIRYANESVAQSGYIVMQIIPSEGTYYIQNAGTEKYIEIEGYSTASGGIIQQWQYHGGNQGKWNIEHVSGSGGYVRLKSVYSNLYMGVDPNDTSQIKQYETQNDYTLWKINRSNYGNLVFVCKATEQTGYVLSVPLSSNSNGTNLAQSVYVEKSTEPESNYMNCSDEWYIVTKVLSLVNYYDSTFVGNSNLQGNIDEAVSFANLSYSRYYNVGIYMDGAATQLETIIDQCTMGTNTPCSDECDINVDTSSPNESSNYVCNNKHHKNTLNISNELFERTRESDHIYILWTNHLKNTFCEEVKGIHDTHDELAVIYGSETATRPIIHFMRIDGDDNVQENCMLLTLVHEIAHVLNMDEVYDDEGHDIDSETDCVMERFDDNSASAFRKNVEKDNEKPFCETCNVAMRVHTSNISIVVN